MIRIAVRVLSALVALALGLACSLIVGVIFWGTLLAADGRSVFVVIGYAAGAIIWVAMVALVLSGFERLVWRHRTGFALPAAAGTVIGLIVGGAVRRMVFGPPLEGYAHSAYALLYVVGFLGALAGVCVAPPGESQTPTIERS